MVFILFSCFCFVLLNILKVDIDPASGSYSLFVNNVNWLSSGPSGYVSNRKWFLTNQNLRLVGFNVTKGKDKHDLFTRTTISWSSSSSSSVDFLTEIYEYENINAVLFDQVFPNGFSETSVRNNNKDLSTMFPNLQNVLPSTTQVHYHTHKNTFCYPENGKWNDMEYEGGALSGPLALYTNETTILMSSVNTFMVGSMIGQKTTSDGFTVGVGLQGSVNIIPAGFRYRSIIFASNKGMSDTHMRWGDYLLSEYNKRRAKVSDDVFIEKLGYWTDNGAFYYYITEPNKNYEETMLGVWEDIKKNNIPVGNIQYDSWWYYRSSKDGGVTLWEPKPDIFPDGMKYLTEKMKIPVGLHNRYFAVENDYMKNYEFYVGDGCSLPKNQDVFDYIMKKAQGWGMTLYEQDWLSKTYSQMDQVQNNTKVGESWMMNMANAAKKLGLTIQLCMPYPVHMMETLQMGQMVTHARASTDYNPKRDQWMIGQTSLFYWAIGIIPFKDNFWTTSDFESGCKYSICEESNPVMQTVVSALSLGPVGYSDKIGMEGIDLIRETCTRDGYLLKADRPAYTLDAMFQQTFEDWASVIVEEVWGTYTCFDGVGCWSYILAIELSKDIPLYPSMLPRDLPSKAKEYFAVKYVTGESEKIEDLIFFNSENPIMLKKTGWHPITDLIGWEMYLIIPKISGCNWNLIKELGKIVSVSKTRIDGYICKGDSLTMTIKGSEGEVVKFAILDLNGSLLYPSCTIPSCGVSKLICGNGKCGC